MHPPPSHLLSSLLSLDARHLENLNSPQTILESECIAPVTQSIRKVWNPYTIHTCRDELQIPLGRGRLPRIPIPNGFSLEFISLIQVRRNLVRTDRQPHHTIPKGSKDVAVTQLIR